MENRDVGGESGFRDGRRDWISDRALRRDDLGGPSCGRSPFSSSRDGDRSPNSRNPFPRNDTYREPDREKLLRESDRDVDRFDERRGHRFNDGNDRGGFIDRSKKNLSRDRSPNITNPFPSDNRRHLSRDRSAERSSSDAIRWGDSRDRFGRDMNRNIHRDSVSPGAGNVDNWGRELRLGNTSQRDNRSPDNRMSRRKSIERDNRRRESSRDGNKVRRSRERDWKRSVDNFLGSRGSRGNSPNSGPRPTGRDSPGRDPARWNDKTEEEWDREIRRFEHERTKTVPTHGRDDRGSPKRRFSPRGRDRRSRSRDLLHRSQSREFPRRSRSRGRLRSQTRDTIKRIRSRERFPRRSHSREVDKPRTHQHTGREPIDSSTNRHKPRGVTPVINEQSEGEDMVISDDDNNEDSKPPTEWKSDDDWEQMMLMKYSRNEDGEDGGRIDYRLRAPQKTVVIRCMPSHVTEVDIHQEITSSNLVCHDIRLVRRKDTGYSRGFAFIEFYNVEDAVSWMEVKQGIVRLGNAKCLMEYSTPRELPAPLAPVKFLSDWICNKCLAHNFSKRFLCFVCSASRTYGDVETSELQASDHPTNTVVLLGLDVLTSEETVLQSIASLSNLPIRSVKVARDPFTSISKGGCYLEMNSVIDAFNLFNTLKNNVPEIDGKRPEVKYARPAPAVPIVPKVATSVGKMGNAAIAAAQWSHQQASSGGVEQYTLADVPRLAEYSASLYATTPSEKIAYYSYYQNYYKEQVSKGAAISLPSDSASGLATAQAALAASKSASSKTAKPLSDPPDGSGSVKYPLPDTSVYQYDPSSGFYYDPYTTLYYDSNSQYYYNTKLGKYLYWDGVRQTYLPTPSSADTPEMSQASAGSAVIVGAPLPASKEDKKKEKDKDDGDRVKVAKRIAKDMEKWAKTLNQKKETAKHSNTIVSNTPPVSASHSGGPTKYAPAAGAADIGFAVLERKDHLSTLGNYYSTVGPVRNEPPMATMVAANVESDDEDETNEDKNHTDWDRLICLLCKRQLGSREALVKHQQMSDLHNQNLAAWYKARGLDPDDAQKRKNQYRDRASERRQKYGMPDTPKPSRLKENYIKSRGNVLEQPTAKGIGADNLGNKLLQKMGWQEGMGLGKSNQGRTSIIEAKTRNATAGLGTRSVGVAPGPGETYKDCVKKMMAVRYAQLDDRC